MVLRRPSCNSSSTARQIANRSLSIPVPYGCSIAVLACHFTSVWLQIGPNRPGQSTGSSRHLRVHRRLVRRSAGAGQRSGPVSSTAVARLAGGGTDPCRRQRRGPDGGRVGQARHRPRGARVRGCSDHAGGDRRCCVRDGLPKGDALAVARIAGIAAAKRTPELIPLCHPVAIHGVTVDLELGADSVTITATVRTADRTGVEMEALTCGHHRGFGPVRHGQGGRPGGGADRHPAGAQGRWPARRLGPGPRDCRDRPP